MAEETPTSTLEEAVQVGHIGQLPPDSPDRSTLGQPAQLEGYAGPATPLRTDAGAVDTSGRGGDGGETDPLEGMGGEGGWYTLPNGDKVQGREEALAALEAYQAEEAAKAGEGAGS